MGVDSLIRGYDNNFRAFVHKAAFVVRTTSNGSGITTGLTSATFGAVEWDSTGGGAGTGGFSQPYSDSPSWWMLGASINTVVLSGTPTAGNHIEAQIQVNTYDPVSGIRSTSYLRSKRNETNSGGEAIVVVGATSMHRGNVQLYMNYYGTSTASIGIASGARLWGYRLGPAS